MKFRHVTLLLALGSAALAGYITAEHAAAQTDVEISDRAYQEFKKANRELVQYGSQIATARISPDTKQQFTTAEHYWFIYRDEEAHFETRAQAKDDAAYQKDGPAQQVKFWRIMEGLTKDRLKQLKTTMASAPRQ